MSQKIRVPIEILELKDDGNHLFVKGKMKTHRVRFLIDTGASHTVLDKNFLSTHFPELKLEKNEELVVGAGTEGIQSHFAELIRVQLGKFRITHYKIAVLDLEHINTAYKKIGVPPIQGVIGCDLLVDYSAVINLRKEHMVLLARN